MNKYTEWKASRKCGTCAKSWTRWMKYHFFDRWHVGSLAWNMRANFKRGLKNGQIAVKFAFGCLPTSKKHQKLLAAKIWMCSSAFLIRLILPLAISSCLREWSRSFEDVPEIQEQSLTVVHSVPKSQFQRCSQSWPNRWNRYKNFVGSNEQNECKSIFRATQSGNFCIRPRS
jgi:hypothetical protein